MYTRSYGTEREVISLPEGYDGIALREEKTEEKRDTGATLEQNQAADAAAVSAGAGSNPWERERSRAEAEESVPTGVGGGIFSGIPFLSGLFEGGRIPLLSSFRLPRLGAEEILIIGAALLMFFSKNGDKECAVILILLLFVS